MAYGLKACSCHPLSLYWYTNGLQIGLNFVPALFYVSALSKYIISFTFQSKFERDGTSEMGGDF